MTDRVKTWKVLGAVAALGLSSASSACAPAGEPVIAPVTMDANDLQGATVDLVVGQVLNINTGDLAVDSYSGEVDDTDGRGVREGLRKGRHDVQPGCEGARRGKHDRRDVELGRRHPESDLHRRRRRVEASPSAPGASHAG